MSHIHKYTYGHNAHRDQWNDTPRLVKVMEKNVWPKKLVMA